jgi:hypothetical protein
MRISNITINPRHARLGAGADHQAGIELRANAQGLCHSVIVPLEDSRGVALEQDRSLTQDKHKELCSLCSEGPLRRYKGI